MSVIDSVKRAPKWAWFTVAGVTAGAIGIRVFKDRAVEPSDPTGTEVGGPVYGAPGTNTSPTPVITSPVIIGGGGGDDGGLASYISTLGGNFDTLVTSVVSLAQGDQDLTGIAIGDITDIATSVVAGAGSAPAPVNINPTVVVTPTHAPAPSVPVIPTPSAPAPRYAGFGPDQHTLCWWQNPNNARKNGKWKWPGEGNNYSHSRFFEGHQTPSGYRTQNCV